MQHNVCFWCLCACAHGYLGTQLACAVQTCAYRAEARGIFPSSARQHHKAANLCRVVALCALRTLFRGHALGPVCKKVAVEGLCVGVVVAVGTHGRARASWVQARMHARVRATYLQVGLRV
eukprot:1161865-Pelagomonas_calceolata.AAC.18